MSRRTATAWHRGCHAAAAVFLTAVLAGEESPVTNVRDYTAGPLTPADFTAAVSADAGELQAFTTTDLRYDLQYRVSRRKQRCTAQVTSFDIQAVVVPAASWNRRPQDARLLDHEQGHFDLTHIAALRARLSFERTDWPSGIGPSDEQAIADLRKQVAKTVAAWVAELKSDHERYDRVTRHGRDNTAQIAERRSQQEQVQALAARWKAN